MSDPFPARTKVISQFCLIKSLGGRPIALLVFIIIIVVVAVLVMTNHNSIESTNLAVLVLHPLADWSVIKCFE